MFPLSSVALIRIIKIESHNSSVAKNTLLHNPRKRKDCLTLSLTPKYLLCNKTTTVSISPLDSVHANRSVCNKYIDPCASSFFLNRTNDRLALACSVSTEETDFEKFYIQNSLGSKVVTLRSHDTYKYIYSEI